jgi:hypothetical protein
MDQAQLKQPLHQVLTYFVAQKNQRGEFLLSPRAHKSRMEAQAFIQIVLGGHGTVVLAAGVVEITPVLTEVLP